MVEPHSANPKRTSIMQTVNAPGQTCRFYSIRYSSSRVRSAVALFFFSMASWTSRMTSLFSGMSSSYVMASVKDRFPSSSTWKRSTSSVLI